MAADVQSKHSCAGCLHLEVGLGNFEAGNFSLQARHSASKTRGTVVGFASSVGILVLTTSLLPLAASSGNPIPPGLGAFPVAAIDVVLVLWTRFLSLCTFVFRGRRLSVWVAGGANLGFLLGRVCSCQPQESAQDRNHGAR
ncbi:hypothetical protein QBC35DRAFT_275139 [Podospora australis]|uniref:Uncharacterized protein n=1 Tax=Podospora australis TaxID=1536484 RepID=A0AAN6WR95_9PEZI|nr:hypothetical protein QBC35DRAFT_275139 [Podospora australis]